MFKYFFVGNYQDECVFWARIMERFFNLLKKPDGYRIKDQCPRAWRDSRKKCGDYNAIYTRLWNGRDSGQDDAQIQPEAPTEYTAKKRSFHTHQMLGATTKVL